jgi:hypothetical protein
MRLLPDSPLASAEPVILVRWCIDRAETEDLKQLEAKDPHILFIIAYEGTRLEERQIVPLNRMATFLTFNRPGKHTVFAKIVWGLKLEEKVMNKHDARSYEFSLLNYRHTNFESDIFQAVNLRCLRGDADFEVEIPKEHFPKEPPAWLMRIVNVGFHYPPVDQCSFRRRLLWLPIKLFFMGIWAVIITILRVLCALFATLFLARGINYGAIIHPWRDDIDDVLRTTNPFNTWLTRRDKDYEWRTSKWIYVCHPMIYVLLFAILSVVKVVKHMTYLQLLHVMTAGIAKLVPWLLLKTYVPLAVLLIGGVALYFLVQRQKEEKRKRLEWENSQEYKDARKLEDAKAYDDLGLLLACRQGIAPTLASLPKDHRTVHLKFLNFKRKVCRPYAVK